MFNGSQLSNDFELMHKDTIVLKYDSITMSLSIVNGSLVPITLRFDENPDITLFTFLDWLSDRLSNIDCTYIDKLCDIRGVGNDYMKIIADSSAISITDNYWIRFLGMERSWGDIRSYRDQNKNLFKVILDDEVVPHLLDQNFYDYTSLYTIKGDSPKIIYKDRMYKKGFNAEYEVVGYRIAKSLDIKVAEARFLGKGLVSCRVFTNESISLLHATEYLPLTDYVQQGHICRSVYHAVSKNLDPLFKRDLERLFILAYVTSNFDLLDDGNNFGFLYDSHQLTLVEVAPAFDFNKAFSVPIDGYSLDYFDDWIVENLPIFIKNNIDILTKIEKTLNIVTRQKYLNQRQKDCVSYRLNNLVELSR